MRRVLNWARVFVWGEQAAEAPDQITKQRQKRQWATLLTLCMYVLLFIASSIGVRTATERVESLRRLSEQPEGHHSAELTNLFRDGQSLVAFFEQILRLSIANKSSPEDRTELRSVKNIIYNIAHNNVLSVQVTLPIRAVARLHPDQEGPGVRRRSHLSRLRGRSAH